MSPTFHPQFSEGEESLGIFIWNKNMQKLKLSLQWLNFDQI